LGLLAFFEPRKPQKIQYAAYSTKKIKNQRTFSDMVLFY